MTKKINVELNKSLLRERNTQSEQVLIDDEMYAKISNVDNMRPFLMSIVSDSNHWMFISSNGGLTAGRKNSHYALFPYYTDDKITESFDTTGSKTIFLIEKEGKNYLWEPFSIRQNGIYSIQRNLYKNSFGNKVIFEEINEDFGLTFRYSWNSSHNYGFIRSVSLKNTSNQNYTIRCLDGIQNILPYGVAEELQSNSSNLVDAYKKSELVKEAQLGIYSLSAIIVDRAEPSEALKANVVWSTGLKNATTLISSLQLDNFRKGFAITEEIDVRAEKGAYFRVVNFTLNAKKEEKWRFVANVNQNISTIVALKDEILKGNIDKKIQHDIKKGAQRLNSLVGAADGLQITQDDRRNTRHFANTMFNIMRGGIFDFNYQIEKADFVPYIKKANKKIGQENADFLASLPEIFTLSDLKDKIKHINDADFFRLATEYLPLKFSRRHGDPSRPWNKFSINTQNELDGSKILDYQGNWRDIFQNWEALAHSYPQFIQGMIYKFLNASTFDGYNPYRVTKDGFDWETIEPDNPWAYIGYWGDHQIIYLLKFLEFIEKHFPGKLNEYYQKECFVYANVPYRIKPYSAIVKDPKNTILYDHEADAIIAQKRKELGADGALLTSPNGEVYKVTFIEKMLATVLAKLANFVPEAGIWMNTQRPEWNDANNALVGNGVSMVTLYYLRRFLTFFKKNIQDSNQNSFAVSKEINTFFKAVHQGFEAHRDLLDTSISNQQRKDLMDRLGTAASNYREHVYEQGFAGVKGQLKKEDLTQFIDTALLFLEDAIRKNKREDGLYHAYNLISIQDKEVSIDYLDEMLEGQVAVLSAGFLDAKESLKVLDALRKSKLYREDQHSYILYPNKTLPLFINRNTIPAEAVKKSMLCQTLIKEGNFQILSQDIKGDYHFNGNFKNAEDLKVALSELPLHYSDLVEKETRNLLDSFEKVFNHKAFTGRSGTFYGYEGLGSIYWHMVSKLALAAYEVFIEAVEKNVDSTMIDQLKQHYYEIVKGIGANKSPVDYGAFPSDPYSHTPDGKGAQQPGMTGQVKEDILSRFGELGVRIEKGTIHFDTALLKEEEYLTKAASFSYFTVTGEQKTLQLKQNSLAFTYCQVPIIYTKGEEKKILISYTNGEEKTIQGNGLDQATSLVLFNRNNTIEKIEVTLSL